MPPRSRYIPKHVKQAVRERDRNRCRLCGSRDYLEFDHMTPHGRGGPPTVDNIQLLCRRCNQKKGMKTDCCPHCEHWLPHGASYCQSCGRGVGRPSAGGADLVRKLAIALLIVFILSSLGLLRC